jgi:mono/diheme cytochrome c family protein
LQREHGQVLVIRAIVLAALIVASSPPHARAADEPAPSPGALIFARVCNTCHNLGGGDKVGPDLLGVTKRREKSWLAKFVRGPAAAIDGGDPVATALVKKFNGVRMPDQALSDDEIDSVWAYFAACTDKGGCLPVPLGPKWGVDGSDEEVAHGRGIFLGERRLQRGGPPCFTCHDTREVGWMGGGSMGANLTFSYARLGERGLEPLLAEMSTPVMHAVYGAAPLEPDERFAVKAYLARLARDGELAPVRRDFFALGLEGMGVVVLGFGIAWRRRDDQRGGNR